MTAACEDIAKYVHTLFPKIDAFDQVHWNGKVKGCLVAERQAPTVETFCNYETHYLDLTIHDEGMGIRGSSRAYEMAQDVYIALRCVVDVTLNKTLYTRIVAQPPYELYGSKDESTYRITIECDRATEQAIEWQ